MGESSRLNRIYSIYSFNVTFSYLLSSDFPILKSALPKRLFNLYIARWCVMSYFEQKLVNKLITYIKLPAFKSWPVICHSSDNTRLIAFFVTLNELFDGKVIDANSLYSISEGSWVMDFEHFVLFLPVPFFTPFVQQFTTPVHWFHIIHLLDKLVRHATSLEGGVGKSSLLGEFYSFMIYDVFNRYLLENFSIDIFLLSRTLLLISLLAFGLLLYGQVQSIFANCLFCIEMVSAGVHRLWDRRLGICRCCLSFFTLFFFGRFL